MYRLETCERVRNVKYDSSVLSFALMQHHSTKYAASSRLSALFDEAHLQLVYF